MLSIVRPTGLRTIVRTPPASSAVVSWNSTAEAGTIDITVYRTDGQVSTWLPYVSFERGKRRSLCGGDDVARILVDVVESPVPISAIEVRSDVVFESLAVSTPQPKTPATMPSFDVFRERIATEPALAPTTATRTRVDIAPEVVAGRILDVPRLSQYLADRPDARGYCSAAALAMLLAFWGRPHPLADVVAQVFDDAYGGTGNWSFNMAYAAREGLRAAVVHLAGLDHAAAFIDAGIPLALSYAWNGDLPGAPIVHSDGHLAVLRGFTRYGHPQMNDPAQPDLVTTYDRHALERAWRGHGGVAYAITPPDRTDDLVRLANA